MNSAAKSPLYFSAYPLKVVEKAAASAQETPQSPYLRALLAGKSGSSHQRLRVSPMINPYKAKPISTPQRPQPTKNVEPAGKDWFNHYE